MTKQEALEVAIVAVRELVTIYSMLGREHVITRAISLDPGLEAETLKNQCFDALAVLEGMKKEADN